MSLISDSVKEIHRHNYQMQHEQNTHNLMSEFCNSNVMFSLNEAEACLHSAGLDLAFNQQEDPFGMCERGSCHSVGGEDDGNCASQRHCKMETSLMSMNQ